MGSAQRTLYFSFLSVATLVNTFLNSSTFLLDCRRMPTSVGHDSENVTAAKCQLQRGIKERLLLCQASSLHIRALNDIVPKQGFNCLLTSGTRAKILGLLLSPKMRLSAFLFRGDLHAKQHCLRGLQTGLSRPQTGRKGPNFVHSAWASKSKLSLAEHTYAREKLKGQLTGPSPPGLGLTCPQ